VRVGARRSISAALLYGPPRSHLVRPSIAKCPKAGTGSRLLVCEQLYHVTSFKVSWPCSLANHILQGTLTNAVSELHQVRLIKAAIEWSCVALRDTVDVCISRWRMQEGRKWRA
jgi:hypothetical protein